MKHLYGFFRIRVYTNTYTTMALVKIKNDKISKKQLIAFYEFALFIYSNTIKASVAKYGFSREDTIFLKSYGFCFMVYLYFGISLGRDEYRFSLLFPDLYAHKPKDAKEFWFPCGGRQTKRIKILKSLLKL